MLHVFLQTNFSRVAIPETRVALHCRISVHPIFCQLRNCHSTFRKTWNQISKIGTHKYRNKSGFVFSRAKQKKVNTIISSLLLPKMLKKYPDNVHI